MNWKQLAANCAINPLTALHDCTNGNLLSRQIERPRYDDTIGNVAVAIDYQRQLFLYKIIREVSDVALAEMEANNCTSKEARKSLNYTYGSSRFCRKCNSPDFQEVINAARCHRKTLSNRNNVFKWSCIQNRSRGTRP